MSSETYDKVYPYVSRDEGGFVNNPKDPGGPTNIGLTLKFLQNTGDHVLCDIDGDGD
ncbi:MAG: hypothetical protein HQK56_21225, partial [Deltaproteobacteria bacterium]|nr:hypothetical protein [Deltaproteobacteria bacterium]